MNKDDLDRESLFAMVWDRPTTEVAKELGISDVALGKLCQRLQVPKPPRGYWAMVKAGRVPKRPSLLAFSEAKQRRMERLLAKEKKIKSKNSVKLANLQLEFFNLALDELAEAGSDTTGIDLVDGSIRSIDEELAAQILILIQNRYDKWLEAGSTAAQSTHGAHSSICGLVKKLIPLAKEQIVVFQKEDDGIPSREGPISVIRFSSMLQRRVAQLCLIARENKLPYVTTEIALDDYAWSVRHICPPDSMANAKTLLCVSAHELWLQCEVEWICGSRINRFMTERLPVCLLVSPELVPNEKIQLPTCVPKTTAMPYANRLKAYMDASQVHDILIDSTHKTKETTPDLRLALLERLWSGDNNSGPFLNARRAMERLEQELEEWENYLYVEGGELCRDIIGIDKGDIVLLRSSKGKMVRALIEDLFLTVTESEIGFHLYGKRFLKDGILGKRQESFYIHVENDMGNFTK